MISEYNEFGYYCNMDYVKLDNDSPFKNSFRIINLSIYPFVY